jgi:hypothetical protein
MSIKKTTKTQKKNKNKKHKQTKRKIFPTLRSDKTNYITPSYF